MDVNRSEDILRNLTIAQLDALRVVLNHNKLLISSLGISTGLKYSSAKSLSALASLQKTEPPIVKKQGKLSARDGIIWSFNEEFCDRQLAKKIVNDIFEMISKSGIMEDK